MRTDAPDASTGPGASLTGLATRTSVINARAAHGWTSPMHSHPPMLVFVLGSGRQKVTRPDGSTQIVDLNPGTVVWRNDAFGHTRELLAGEVDVVLVELKSADAASA